MEIKNQSNIRQLLSDTMIPKMVKIRQHFDTDSIKDVASVIRDKLNDEEISSRIKPGMRIVLTGSSRQISNMNVILREIVSFCKGKGRNSVYYSGNGEPWRFRSWRPENNS